MPVGRAVGLPAGRAIALAVALAAPAALAAPGVATTQENRPIDADELAAVANAPQIEDATLSAALIKGKPAATSFTRPVMLPGGHRVVVWSECSKVACMGYWALLDGDNESLKVLARGPLPVRERADADDGYAFSGTSVADLDGSGRPLVLFHYQVSEPPRTQLGALSHEYVTIFDPATRKVAFHHELKRSGAPTENSCSYGLIRRTRNNVPAIEVQSTCAVRACLGRSPPPGCAPATTASEKFVLKNGSFVPAH